MNKEITQIQIAWFFSDIYKGNLEEFSLRLKSNLGESKLTQLLPIPNDMPNEIPRLVLTYEAFNLNVAKNRLDIFFKDFSMMKEKISKIGKVILEDFKIKVGRVGFVKTIYLEGDIENLKKLLKGDEVEKLDLKEVSIRINERKQIIEHDCNNIESSSIGFVIKKEADGHMVKKEGIIITRDLNTMAEKISENNFKKDEIDKLIDAFDTESNNFILANLE